MTVPITFTAKSTDAAGNTACRYDADLKNTVSTSSLSGFVYVDSQNGPMTSSSTGIQGVVVMLNGGDSFGNPVPTQTTTTTPTRSYHFTGLPSGVYSITEDQPVQVVDGVTSPGNLGGTAGTNVISQIALNVNAAGVNYNFIEHGIPQQDVSINLLLASTPPPQQYFANLVSTGGSAYPVLMSMVKNSSESHYAGHGFPTCELRESVSGVDTTDFTTVASSGLSGSSIASVTGSGSTYTVTLNTGTGNGTLGLELVDNDSIVDSLNNALGGTGAGNGNYWCRLHGCHGTAAAVHHGESPGRDQCDQRHQRLGHRHHRCRQLGHGRGYRLGQCDQQHVHRNGRRVRQLDRDRHPREQPGRWHDHIYRHRHQRGQ